jgi:hypothetical protein
MKLDISVRKETGYGLGDWGSIPIRARYFSLHHHYLISSGAHPASYPIGVAFMGTLVECQADHFPLSSTGAIETAMHLH